MNFLLRPGHSGRLPGLLPVAALIAAIPVPAPGQAPLVPLAQPEAGPATAATQPALPPEGSVGGMGDVNLYPKRVVISDRERTATVGLYNRAPVSGDYDIAITDMTMLPDGRLVDLASVSDPAVLAAVRSASAMLRWSPHRVSLPANEAQLVRIMARVPPELPPGEYRAHFSAISVPPETGELSIEQAAGAESGGVGVQIVPRFGISIPVIVRVGETTLTTGMRDLKVIRPAGGPPAFALRIMRQGTRSAFGNITVTSSRAKKPLGEIKGVGIYTEIEERSVQIPVDAAADPALYARGAVLTVTYIDDDFAPGKVLARQDFTVP